MTAMEFVARVIFVPTDMGIYLTAIIMVVLTQTLIWAIGRYSLDLDLWRCLALCAVAGMAGIVSAMGIGGINGMLAGWVFGAFAGYLIGGVLYDFELWQRIMVAVVVPVFALISFIAGYWLKGLLMENVFS